jgi:adenine-specific DNA-methyltransferase
MINKSTINSQQIALLKKHFANCFDKNGNFIPAKLQEIVQDSGVALSKEGYSLNWLGKSYARLLANENVRTLLKADTAHNDRNAKSQNLLIKGDNLEVLKHLMGAYSEQVKMIYIDPPYNTGSDGFVYQDDRKFTPEQLSSLAGIDEDEAKRILEFTSSKSNSHSAWLTFMYPRLYLAKQLLRDDGVIFISIDDNEQAQLKVLCDEVFGEENFVACIAVKLSEASGVKMAHVEQRIPKLKEYILFYKNFGNIKIKPPMIDKAKWDSEYRTVCLGLTSDELESIKFVISDEKRTRVDLNTVENLIKKISFQTASTVCKQETGNDVSDEWLFSNAYRIVQFVTLRGGAFELARIKKETFDTNSAAVFLISTSKNKVYLIKSDFNNESTQPRCQLLFADDFLQINSGDFWLDIKTTGLDNEGDIDFKNGKKPLKLVKRCLNLASQTGDIVLDFFAGSGTTAHAVMQLNAEDGGKRQFICVQIDEATDPKGEAYKAGYATIFDITQARISKAAAKIQAETPEFKGDLGFQIFETIPIFEKYLDAPEELTENLELFDVSTLSHENCHDLMLTWALRDGIKLGAALTCIKLGGYTAFAAGEILYFIEPDISLNAVVALLEKLDSDPTFAPSHLVVLGYLLDSKMQREMSEAVKQYNNRKGIELTLDIRYN